MAFIGQQFFDDHFGLIWLEALGTALAVIRDFSVDVDQTHTVWPALIGLFRYAIHRIHKHWQRELQFADTPGCEDGPLLNGLRLTVKFAFQPFGVGLGDVYQEKLNSVLVRHVQVFQGPGLGAERRSRVAAEDQTDRLLTLERRERDQFAADLSDTLTV